jgi:hypothetical protein
MRLLTSAPLSAIIEQETYPRTLNPSYTPLTLPHREMRDVRGNALRKGWRSEMAFGNTVQETNRTRPDQTVLRWSTALSAYCNDQLVRLGGGVIL